MVAVTTAPPSTADAEKAAEAVASEGASAVLLFGSVARGGAEPHSDCSSGCLVVDCFESALRGAFRGRQGWGAWAVPAGAGL